MKHFIVALLISTLVLTACKQTYTATAETSATIVLTSTTFLADITRNVAGDRLQVESLLPVGADPHSYQPVPQDLVKINQSKLMIINGLEYERFLEALLQNAGGKQTIVTAIEGLQ